MLNSGIACYCLFVIFYCLEILDHFLWCDIFAFASIQFVCLSTSPPSTNMSSTRLLSRFLAASTLAVLVLFTLDRIRWDTTLWQRLHSCLGTRPDVLLVGNVTVDVVHGNRTVVSSEWTRCIWLRWSVQGGAISYAAAVLEVQGKRACVVTSSLSRVADCGWHVWCSCWGWCRFVDFCQSWSPCRAW